MPMLLLPLVLLNHLDSDVAKKMNLIKLLAFLVF